MKWLEVVAFVGCVVVAISIVLVEHYRKRAILAEDANLALSERLDALLREKSQ